MDNGDSHLWGVLSNAEWDLLKWIFKQVGWASMIAVLGGAIQKLRSGSVDWWVLGTIFVSSVAILYATVEGPRSSAVYNLSFWLIGGVFVFIVVSIAIWAYFGLPITRGATSLRLSPQDMANREKIVLLFYSAVDQAGGKLQQSMNEIFEQLKRTGDKKDTVMFELARRGVYDPYTNAFSELRRGVEGTADLQTLQRLLEEFFVAYQLLVHWMYRLSKFLPGDLIKIKAYVSWLIEHSVFHKKLSDLLEAEGFKKSRENLKAHWNDTF